MTNLTEPVSCRLAAAGDLPGPVLALDTSGALEIAIVRPDGRVVTRRSDVVRRHAELLAPLIADALEEAGLAVRNLAAIAVGTGPASFTGLRVGLMTARALALPASLPVWGVCSLDATAVECARRLGEETGELVIVRDAKRREVFHARYRLSPAGPQRIAGPAVSAPGELSPGTLRPGELSLGESAPGTPGAVIAGDTSIAIGYGLDLAGWRAPAELDGIGVDPVALALIAVARTRAGVPTDVEPLYLRRPDVQVPGGAKRASQ